MSRGDFWSRRKAAVEAEQQAAERAFAEEVEAERELALAEKSDEEILDELGLPDPDTLSEGDDFSAFLTDKVPARLKTRALRRLWMSNPVLANVDGLVDYGEDFTDAGNVIENLQTAYQVGKGMTAHVEALLRGKDEDAVLIIADDEDASEEEEAVNEEFLTAVPDTDVSVATHEVQDQEDTAPMPAPRRMRFSFNEAEATA